MRAVLAVVSHHDLGHDLYCRPKSRAHTPTHFCFPFAVKRPSSLLLGEELPVLPWAPCFPACHLKEPLLLQSLDVFLN